MIEHADLVRALDYDPRTGIFTWATPRPRIRIGQVAGFWHHKGYRRLEVNGRGYAAHRLAWFYFYGAWPEGQIDHVNLDKADNRIANLRIATNGQNCANRPTRNAHGLKGIRFMRHMKRLPWQAQFSSNGRTEYLGCFATPEEAHEAHAKRAREVYGDFFRP